MNARLTAGLRLLLDAADYARDAGKPPEHFSVELADLTAAGVLHIDVQWLLTKGYLKPIAEEGSAGKSDVSSKPDSPSRLSARARFILTPSGIRLARQLGNGAPPPEPPQKRTGRSLRIDPAQPKPPGPRWDPATRRLYFGHTLVKQFLVPAKNQQAVLEEFERLGWPECIANPLSDGPETSAKQRLHDTINRLNDGQHPPRIRFHGDGTGNGLRWEVVHLEQHKPRKPASQRVRTKSPPN